MPAKKKDDFGKGLNQEVNFNDDQPANQPGLYRHPEAGVELIAYPNSRIGSAQADGLVRVGFEYVGPVDHAKLREEQKRAELSSGNTDAQVVAANKRAEDALKEAEIARAELKKALALNETVDSEQELENEESESEDVEEEDVDPTEGLSRAKLNEMAKDLGLNPADYQNRDHLAEAINEKIESQKEN